MTKIRIEKVKNHIKESYENLHDLKNDLKAVNNCFYTLVQGACFLIYDEDITQFLADSGYKICKDDGANFRKYARVLKIAYNHMIIDSLFQKGGTLA